MSFYSICIIALTTLCTSRRNDYIQAASNDEITSLPGLDKNILSNYTMFSGYIDIYPAHNKSIHYWFVESLNDAKTDPVAFWTNGGPGGSGMIGFFAEMGPFRALKNLTLIVNPYSWVNLMSMIFVEIPVGVGFSFSNTSSDYTTDDNNTAIDNYHFCQQWLNKFPNYQSNSFYITSESYGGRYAPTLAQQIIIGNKAGNKPLINLKGIFVGNPSTDIYENQRGRYDTLYGHQLVSQPIFEQWYIKCKNGNISYHKNTDCANARTAMNNAVGSNINVYALDYPVCNSESKDNEIYLFYKHYLNIDTNIPIFYQKMITYFDRYPEKQFYYDPDRQLQGINSKINKFPDPQDALISYEPCSEHYMTNYLNEESVQNAIHVKHKKWPGTNIKYNNTHAPMEPIWQWIIDNDPTIHLTIVSGDDDIMCATLGTQSWIWNMGWNVDVNNNWKIWTDINGQTGGYLTKFEKGMNLVTVHSAGHMIPWTQPSRSLQTLTRYLKGEF